MKSYLTYGAFCAIGNAAVTLILHLTGFHSDPAKFQTGNTIFTLTGLVIGISLLVIGIRAKRATVPDTQEFNYGQALGAGVMISLFAALFGTAFQFVYHSYINPGFAEVVIQAQTAKLQAAGLSSDKIDKAAQFMRLVSKPSVQAITGFIGSMVASVIISLIAAGFLKRKAVEPPVA